MNEQEIQEVLDELHKVRPEKLNDKGKRLFNAIMSIIDERDLYKQRIDKAIEYIENCGGMELVNDYSFPEKPIIDKEAKTNLLKILKGSDKE